MTKKVAAPKIDLTAGKFIASPSKIHYRPGQRPGWYEFIVTKPDGTQTKMVARTVDRFYSEATEPSVVEKVTL
jgi:hypothetical protein